MKTEMIHTPKILLLSGGLDSTTLLYDCIASDVPVLALLAHYKSAHNDFELSCAKFHCKRLGVNFRTIELPPLGGLTEKSWVVPARNLILLSLAANVAVEVGAEEILVGFNAADEAGFPDCRQAFVQMLNNTFTTAEIPVQVVAPYLFKQKWEIGDLARQLGVPMEFIWTCYTPTKRGEQCGKCPACLKLKEALR